jgi:hypothetical protein
VKQILQQRPVEVAQFLSEPVPTGKGALGIKAIGSAWVQGQMEAQFEDEQGMFEQKIPEVRGVDQAFVDAYQKGFEVGTLWMGRAPTRRALLLPVLNQRPIEHRKASARGSDNGIMLEKACKSRMVKDRRSRSQNRKLLL